MQNLAAPQRIVFTKQQVEDIRKFTSDLEANKIEVAFEGSLLEGIAFLKGSRDIVDSCSH